MVSYSLGHPVHYSSYVLKLWSTVVNCNTVKGVLHVCVFVPVGIMWPNLTVALVHCYIIVDTLQYDYRQRSYSSLAISTNAGVAVTFSLLSPAVCALRSRLNNLHGCLC